MVHIHKAVGLTGKFSRTTLWNADRYSVCVSPPPAFGAAVKARRETGRPSKVSRMGPPDWKADPTALPRTNSQLTNTTLALSTNLEGY